MHTSPDAPAARLTDLLDYVEQVVRLDERVALRIDEHRLPNGQSFVLHQHELQALPGVRHDLLDEDGPIWLAVQRLRRGNPPEPPELSKDWIELSPDPDRVPTLRESLIRTVSETEKDAFVEQGAARSESSHPALKAEARAAGLWDVRLELGDAPTIKAEAEEWIAGTWLPWALAERPVRRTLRLYQRLFEVAQLSELAGGGQAFELVWGIGVSRCLKDDHAVDLPLLERLVEIEIDDAAGAEIRVRPRAAPAAINLSPYEALAVEGWSLAQDAASRAIAVVDPEEGLSPFRPETFEPALRACQARLDPEGVYLPDRLSLSASDPLPPGDARLSVSDRWVLYGRRRSESFILADLENLKRSVAEAAAEDRLPGPAKTLVLGPERGIPDDAWKPLSARIEAELPGEPAAEGGLPEQDLFFPKPFNDDQIEIVRRLERADGVVVQGPPGTGKTHTISNIVCHYMATGRRVLVVSHGEAALAVLRDHLPEGVRDLAISVTSTEREGFRQLETAIRLLQATVEGLKPGEQTRVIRDLQQTVLGVRERLDRIDGEIAGFATLQLTSTPTGQAPADLARSIAESADRHRWFEDRPTRFSSEVGFVPEIERLRTARIAVGEKIEHLEAELPSVQDLPDGETVSRLHEDLVRAAELNAAAQRDPDLKVRLASPEDVQLAREAAEAAARLRTLVEALEATPWLKAIASPVITGSGAIDLGPLLVGFADEARPVALERQRYVARPVELPDGLGPEITALVRRLAEGEAVFGFFAFRERGLRPVVEAIRIEGRVPAGPEEWAHVRDHLAWRERVATLQTRWRALAEELGAPAVSSARELADLAASLDAVFVKGVAAASLLCEAQGRVTAGGPSRARLLEDMPRLAALEEALRNSVAAAQLSAARADIARVSALFGPGSGKLGALAQDLLTGALGRQDVGSDRIARLWDALRRQIDEVRGARQSFEVIGQVAREIELAGAPLWAARLRSVSATKDGDALIPADWNEAWDWAASAAYLSGIDDRGRLRRLADERVKLDGELRKAFEVLVRERTFYELARSMTGRVRGALMMFATALRKTGKGTGKGAARHRRDARTAMAQSYEAIPCWIIPAWRVSEQLPPEVGSFDLVIMDEASQSDIRDVPALLRGKKILVVGDDKQVSPSAAFIENAKIERLEHNFLQGQPFKTLLLPGASLYDLARVMFPDKLVMLKEHFRCVEPIIRFSMQFYPEPLVPLRVPSAQERIDPPLVDIYVTDGRREGDKQNRREAQVIVQEIRNVVDDPKLARIGAHGPWRSIGVVSLIGAKQAALINRLLLDELGEELMRRHRIACGDSATFQGNERDIVFLSMIADPKHKQSQTAAQFEQRFNVAMSRARDRLVLVRSVREEDLKAEDLKARVIRHFRDPMAGVTRPAGDLEALCDSDFERDVLRRLVARGYRVTPQVGAQGYRIDLVVEGVNGRRLAVECDGDRYHGPERWADDMRRQRILERVGWTFWRCWASSFMLDPDGCMADLYAVLQRMGIEPDQGPTTPAGLTVHRTVGPALAGESPPDPIIVPGQAGGPEPRGAAKANGAAGIRVGDRVVIRYLDTGKAATFTLTSGRDDLSNGFLSLASPLGRSLIGLEEDDEGEFEVGGAIRKLVVVRAERNQALAG